MQDNDRGCKNCLAYWPPPAAETAGKLSAHGDSPNSMLAWSINFFKYFKAKYYCFSSNPFGKHANPDTYTVASIVDGYKQWSDGIDPNFKETNILLTNGMSFNGYKLFLERAKICTADAATADVKFNIYIMKR